MMVVEMSRVLVYIFLNPKRMDLKQGIDYLIHFEMMSENSFVYIYILCLFLLFFVNNIKKIYY